MILVLLIKAGQITRAVHEVIRGRLNIVTEADKTGRLPGGIDIEAARDDTGWFSIDTDRPAFQTGETDLILGANSYSLRKSP